MRTLLFFVLLVLIAPASGSDWDDKGTVTLKWGESTGFYNYNITAVDFRPGTVEEHPEKCANETSDYGRKIFGCDDWVFLKISKNGNHVLDAALAKENYTFADGAVFYNETTYEDNENSLKIIALDVITGENIPTPYANIKVLLKKNAIDLDISKNLTINKIVPAEANVRPCYQFISVTISVENTGIYKFSYIRVADDAGEGFISEPSDLNWSISLDRGETWQTTYKIKPLKPIAEAKYDLPPATLHLRFSDKIYNLSTGNPSFILHSSDIILSKTVGMEKEGNITINLGVKNNGSRAAQIKVWDSLIPDAEHVSGDMNFSTVLQPGGSYSQNYTLKLKNVEATKAISDNISLPPANFSFDEYKPCYDREENQNAITGQGISNSAQIKFAGEASTPVQITSTPSLDEPPVEVTPDKEVTFAKNLTTGILQIRGYKLPYIYLVMLIAGVVSVILLVLKKLRKEQRGKNVDIQD